MRRWQRFHGQDAEQFLEETLAPVALEQFQLLLSSVEIVSKAHLENYSSQRLTLRLRLFPMLAQSLPTCRK